MLTKRYLTSTKNLTAIMSKIVEGTAPRKFTIAHLKSLGFKSSSDQSVLPLLKDLRFLSDDGTPLPRYHAYRDASRSRAVMAEALREAYEDLFHISEKPGSGNRAAIQGKIKSSHNVSDKVAQLSAATFLALLSLADLDEPRSGPSQVGRKEPARQESEVPTRKTKKEVVSPPLDLRYNVEIHLPASKDIEVYNAIFRSLKEHLLDE